MARSKRTTPPSANKREYDRIRKNILARMRYREKQGFKVIKSTRPQPLAKPTKRDIERLSKYQVGLNQYGEIVAQSPRRGAYVTEPTVEQVISAKEYLKKMKYENTPNKKFENVREEQEVEMDWVGMVYSAIGRIKEHADAILSGELGFLWEAEAKEAVLLGVYDHLEAMIDYQVEAHDYEVTNDYYRRRFTDISEAVSYLLQLKYAHEMQEFGMGALRQLLIVP